MPLRTRELREREPASKQTRIGRIGPVNPCMT